MPTAPQNNNYAETLYIILALHPLAKCLYQQSHSPIKQANPNAIPNRNGKIRIPQKTIPRTRRRRRKTHPHRQNRHRKPSRTQMQNRLHKLRKNTRMPTTHANRRRIPKNRQRIQLRTIHEIQNPRRSRRRRRKNPLKSRNRPHHTPRPKRKNTEILGSMEQRQTKNTLSSHRP